MSRKLRDDYTYRDRGLPISELRPHPKIQRAFDKKHAERLHDAFDPAAMGLIWVQEKSGKFFVFDGQHRVWAVRKWLNGDAKQEVLCRVFTNLTDETAAKLSGNVNRAKTWTPIDAFLRRLVANDPIATAVHRVLQKYGLQVRNAPTAGSIRAVSACEKSYTRGGEAVFNRAISVLHEAWGTNPDGYHAAIISGTTLFLLRHGDSDVGDLTRKLAKSSAVRIIGHAREAVSVLGLTVDHAVAHLLVCEYNKQRRVNRLPDWTRAA